MIFAAFSLNQQISKAQKIRDYYTQKSSRQLTALPLLQTPEEKDDFKHTLSSFLRLYAFLSQIVPFQDPELEKLYAYGRLLLNKLPKDTDTKYTIR